METVCDKMTITIVQSLVVFLTFVSTTQQQVPIKLRVIDAQAEAIAKCNNKLMTSFSRMMLDAIRPTSVFEGSISLQQRFIAGVHLYGGEMRGFQTIQPIEEPTRLFCYNNTIAALQMKFKVPDVETVYGFAFAAQQEVRGKITLKRQEFFIDIDLEKDQVKNETSLLGIYLSQPDDRFKFEIEMGAESKDIDKIQAHVAAISHQCFSRDARTALTLAFAPKIEEFLLTHTFSLE